MATIRGNRVDRDDRGVAITWAGLANATSDVGGGAYIGDLEDVTVQAITGTSADTEVIQGSNDGVSWAPLGAGLTLTIAVSTFSPVTAVTPKPLYIRPATPSAHSVTVIVAGFKRG